MAQQFEQPQVEQSLVEQSLVEQSLVEQPQDAAGTGRAQRMTADESRAVIDLWEQERVEQTGLTDKPAVPDVAEGLDITVEDVQRLLQDVRAKRIAEEHALATEQELSEIRLAEEERKLAEIRRQRAELRREQSEGERRRQIDAAKRRSQPARPVTARHRSAPTKQDTRDLVYRVGGVVLFLWFAACLYYIVATALP